MDHIGYHLVVRNCHLHSSNLIPCNKIWVLNMLSLSWILLIGWDNVIRLWDLSNSSLDLVSEFDCGKPTSPCLDISFVNNVATVGTFNKKVKSFDLRCPSNTNAIEQYLHHSKPVLAVHIPKRREELLLSASEDGSVALIDRRARKLVNTLKFSNKCYPLCMDMIDGDNCLYVSIPNNDLPLIKISLLVPLPSDNVLYLINSNFILGRG